MNVAENTTGVTIVTATDVDLPPQTQTYSITGGADAAKFSINSSTGALSFISAPNFEAPSDVGANNVYDVTVQVSDGSLADTQAIAVTVTDVNEAPNAPSITQVTDNVLPVTGTVANGGSTNDTTPTVRVSLSGTGAVAGDTVQLFNGGSMLGAAVSLSSSDISAGFKDITPSALSQGTYNLNATITDAGNTSAASSNYTVTIDTTPPTAPSITQVTDDVLPVIGIVANGGSTNDTAPTVRVSLSGTGAVNNDTVQLFNGSTALGSAVTLHGSDINAGFVDITLSALTSGTAYSLNAKITDAAGNTSLASSSYSVTIDTAAPPAPSTPDLTAAADSGLSNTDNITNVTTPTFTGTAESGSTITIFDGVTAVGSGTATGGTYSITTSVLSNGVHNITVKATDAAGNTGVASGSLSMTIDTAAPAVPTTPDLTLASDSGSSNTDNITKVTTPSFTGTAESGSTVTIFDGVTAVGSGTAIGGTYTITTSALSNGPHSITATATDAAGNTGLASSSLSVTVDATGPTVTITSTALGNSTGSTSTITFQFSESVNGFDFSDATPTRGSLSNFTQVDGDTFTATFTRTASGNVGVTVAAGTYTDTAGNSGLAGNSGNFPAGIAGEPINLALTDPSTDTNDFITVTVAGVPSDWTLNAGTDNGDGTWTVQTNNPSALTITTPASYTGAMLLPVTMNWTNADGTMGSAVVIVNLEAYASGSPIFAVSADDHLTGSSGADLFVFAQPIARDTLHNFDVSADKIDLIGFSGVSGYGDLVIANDANGNAVVTISNNETIVVLGVDATALNASNFVFNQEPAMINAGIMTISDGAILPLGGTINNTGTIALDSTGSETDLEILVHSATLQGGGNVTLSDNSQNVIYGGSADATLVNIDNTISGAGHLGNGQLTLVNSGTIVANGVNALDIDTGVNVVTNAGILEATGTGGLIVHGDLANSGLLWANGGNITVTGDVSGSGNAIIDGSAILDFGGASTQDTLFAASGDGTLKLENSSAYTGTVSGFGEGDHLDLADIISGPSTTISYVANADGTGGTLMLTDGEHTADIHLAGQYAAQDFHLAMDGGTGTLISYLPSLTPTDPVI